MLRAISCPSHTSTATDPILGIFSDWLVDWLVGSGFLGSNHVLDLAMSRSHSTFKTLCRVSNIDFSFFSTPKSFSSELLESDKWQQREPGQHPERELSHRELSTVSLLLIWLMSQPLLGEYRTQETVKSWGSWCNFLWFGLCLWSQPILELGPTITRG